MTQILHWRRLQSNSIGDVGVIAVLTVLRHPNSALEKLDFRDNSIGDIGINALADELLNNSMLRGHPDVTPTGWVNFSTILRNPTSALEVIDVSNDFINDDVMHTFKDALQTTASWKFSMLVTFTTIISPQRLCGHDKHFV